MGVPFHSAPYPCPECHDTADQFGDHQVGCRGNADRHNAICDALFVTAQSAALTTSREAHGVVADSLLRPADVLLPNWHCDRPAALDVQISPLQDLTLRKAACIPGHALQVGVQRKLTSHLANCRASGVEFIPIVAETLGDLAEDTVNTIWRAIVQRISSHISSTSSTSHLFHHLAISLWWGNACLWIHRHPPLPSPPPSVDGVI